MAAKKQDNKTLGKIAAQNRRARHDYFILETLEAGLMLKGSEVKSLREGRASITEAYATEEKGELWLRNAYIPEYSGASTFSHEPRSARKLLVHHREVTKLNAATQRKGMTLVPLKIYFNPRGIAKLLIGVAEGKKNHDKRHALKERDWGRQKARLMREKE
ncbi:MAG: SsrA-binding protein [Rhodospirillaceae bacterium TMED8]|nr:SsrA-binding protein [Magnetovibrio sp.]OUT51605.1 MAG: SsrA-binding protein [Rhodospirillaceae bacterium TMED8]